MPPTRPLRWAVLVVSLDPVVGHEQAGERRALVVSYEPYHQSGNMTICPITAARATPRYPTEVTIPAGEAGQTLPAVILCQQVRTVSVQRARSLKGFVTNSSIRAAVRAALARHLGLDIAPLEDGASGSSIFK